MFCSPPPRLYRTYIHYIMKTNVSYKQDSNYALKRVSVRMCAQ
uniref:Uncharacterized protein n=1 Tax=Anguilla anguilla TaxID=7936 RepID=A0A0E9XF59_ANGAN